MFEKPFSPSMFAIERNRRPKQMKCNGLQDRFTKLGGVSKHFKALPIPLNDVPAASNVEPLPGYAGHVPQSHDYVGTAVSHVVGEEEAVYSKPKAMYYPLQGRMDAWAPKTQHPLRKARAAWAGGGDAATAATKTTTSYTLTTSPSKQQAALAPAPAPTPTRTNHFTALEDIPPERSISYKVASEPVRRWSPFENIQKYSGHVPRTLHINMFLPSASTAAPVSPIR